ncbi:MAG: outer membrane lipoprotein carrier protein LolA [Rhodospirillaceae bacterium]|nr:outer membrane lipoprotein carrier protein LolA [Rhodospirillaceae bacterium]MBT6830413.1 outer membrane lipoprotein carrier protein LolA [Rhodospirillaceae bacterium]
MRAALASFVATWFVVGLLVPAVNADTGVQAIQSRLLKSEMLRAEFYQEKNLRALSRPLISRGKLLFVAGEGVLWQVEKPFTVSVLIRSDEVIEWSSEGEVTRLNTGSNPVFRALSEIILATLSGDTQFLGQLFDLSSTVSEAGWQLLLQPKSEELAAAVSNIKIIGDRFVEEVQVSETKGDITVLQFREFKVGPFELNEFEKNHFAQ